MELYIAPEFQVKADSSNIIGGKFNLKANLDNPRVVHIYIRDNEGNNIYMMNILAEAGSIHLVAEKGKDRVPRVINSKLNDDFVSCRDYARNLQASKDSYNLSKAINKYYLAGDKENVNNLEIKKIEITKSIIDSILAWKPTTVSKQVQIYYVCDYASSLPISEQIEISNIFPKNYKGSYYLNKFREDIENAKKVELGCFSPNFKLKDLSGKEYSLDSFKGKYIFLEFSASWCGWCKKEIPFVRAAYNELKDKNIAFVTVNMDTTREKWEGDVTKENIEWFCLSNLEGMNSDLAKSFNIHGIPACFVIDPNGKIIKKDIRGTEVLKYLSQITK